jgi:hypothetical protein
VVKNDERSGRHRECPTCGELMLYGELWSNFALWWDDAIKRRQVLKRSWVQSARLHGARCRACGTVVLEPVG